MCVGEEGERERFDERKWVEWRDNRWDIGRREKGKFVGKRMLVRGQTERVGENRMLGRER